MNSVFLWSDDIKKRGDITMCVLCVLLNRRTLCDTLAMKSGKYGNTLCVKSQFICEYVSGHHTQERHIIMCMKINFN